MSAWIDQMFDAAIASKEGVVRRQIDDVVKYASYPELMEEVRTRNWHLIETGDQFIIICNTGAIKIHC